MYVVRFMTNLIEMLFHGPDKGECITVWQFAFVCSFITFSITFSEHTHDKVRRPSTGGASHLIRAHPAGAHAAHNLVAAGHKRMCDRRLLAHDAQRPRRLRQGLSTSFSVRNGVETRLVITFRLRR